MTIWTIGHSTHPLDEFLSMLGSFSIRVLADIRSYPGSKRYPHFNRENLEGSLESHNIEYIHLPGLGGRRKSLPDSSNTGWRNTAFRGYADYMQTEEFKKAIVELAEVAVKKPAAYMCSEAAWWRCHRSLVSDYFKAEGWTVMHIMGTGKASGHPYTSPARIEHGKLTYTPGTGTQGTFTL